MNNFYKIVSTIFLVMFLFLIFAPAICIAAPAQFKPQITIGEFQKGIDTPVSNTGETIWNYIKAIYKYAIGVVGIVAAVVLMIGGIMWLTAGGNQTRIGEAKAYIGASLSGLLLALTSFMILATVNPKLTQFNPLDVTTVEDNSGDQNSATKGCCKGFYGTISMYCQDNVMQLDCKPSLWLVNNYQPDSIKFELNKKCVQYINTLGTQEYKCE